MQSDPEPLEFIVIHTPPPPPPPPHHHHLILRYVRDFMYESLEG